MDFLKGFIIGFILTAFLFHFYLLFDSRVINRNQMSKLKKHGVYSGAFTSFCVIYIYLSIAL